MILDANPAYWNLSRGPRLARVVFRNDLSPSEALKACIETEGQVDLVTSVSPGHARAVLGSPFARLMAVDSGLVAFGIFNEWVPNVPFQDWRLREVLNLAIDRSALVRQGFEGYARPIPALTPPWAFDFPAELQPKPHDPAQARQLLRDSGWLPQRPLRIAAPSTLSAAAEHVASAIRFSLGIAVQVMGISPQSALLNSRMMAEKKLIPPWDLLVTTLSALYLEGTPAFLHRELFSADGSQRTGPLRPQFDSHFVAMAREADPKRLLALAAEIDRYVYRESLALFLCAPQALYAVNRHVSFRPYRTSLELAETEVSPLHWSLRG